MFRAFFFLALLLAFPANAQPKVVVTYPVLHSLAAMVLEGIGAPELLLAQPHDTHHFQLRPSQMRQVTQADVVIFHHPQLENFIPKLEQMTPASMHYLQLGNSPSFDWLGPDQAIVSLQLIAKMLAGADPKHAEYYYENAARHQEIIGIQAAGWGKKLSPNTRPPVILSDHPAFAGFTGYFALPEVIALEDSHGNIRPKQLKQLKRKGVACLLATHGKSQMTQQIAKVTGARLIAFNPLGYGLTQGTALYENLLSGLVQEFAECLTYP